MRLAAYLLWIPGLFAVIAAVILPVVSSGLAVTETRGQRLGRPPAITPAQIRHARALLSQPDAQGRVVRVEEASLFEPAVQRGTLWCLTFA
jgi:hypothetical protein